MNHGDGQQCCEAGCEPLQADDHTTILVLEPGQGALGLAAWPLLLHRPPTRGRALPDPCEDLRPDASLTELLAQRVGVIPFVGHDHLQAFPRVPPPPSPETDRVQQWDNLGPLVAVRRYCAMGP